MVAIKSCSDCKTWVVVYGVCKKEVSVCAYVVYKRFGIQELSVKYSSWCQIKQMKPCYLSCGNEGGTRDHREEALCYGIHIKGCNYTYCWVLLMKSCMSVIIKTRFPISWATPSKILNESIWGESRVLMILLRWFWYTLIFKNNWPKAGKLKLPIKELILKTNNCGGREER